MFFEFLIQRPLFSFVGSRKTYRCIRLDTDSGGRSPKRRIATPPLAMLGLTVSTLSVNHHGPQPGQDTPRCSIRRGTACGSMEGTPPTSPISVLVSARTDMWMKPVFPEVNVFRR